MTQSRNAVAAKGGQMAIRSKRASVAPKRFSKSTKLGFIFGLGERSLSEAGRPTDGKTMMTASTWRRLIAVGCLGAMSLGLTGCSTFTGACRALRNQNQLDEFMIGHRNQALAAKAWHRVKHGYANKQYYNDFKAGFFDGYADVAAGGPGCIPAVAPTSYWGWKYQSRDGQAAVNAYFEGYPLGVKAAEQDGVGYWGHVPTNFGRRPQPLPATMPLAAAAAQSGEDEPRENPFYPEPDDVDDAQDLGTERPNAIEFLPDPDDSVQFEGFHGTPFSGSGVLNGGELVHRTAGNQANAGVRFELADRPTTSSGSQVSASLSDQGESIESVFGAPANMTEPLSAETSADTDPQLLRFE